MRDLSQRCQLFQNWVQDGMPKVGKSITVCALLAHYSPALIVYLWAIHPAGLLAARFYLSNRVSHCFITDYGP